MNELMFWIMLLIIFTMGGIITGMKWFMNSMRSGGFGHPYGGYPQPPINGNHPNDSWSNIFFLLITGGILLGGFYVKKYFEETISQGQVPVRSYAEPRSATEAPAVEAKVNPTSPINNTESQEESTTTVEPEVSPVMGRPLQDLFYIQVGAFDNWEGVIERFNAWNGYKGMTAVVHGPDTNGRYKVWLGSFNNRKKANEFIEQFNIPGFPTTLPNE